MERIGVPVGFGFAAVIIEITAALVGDGEIRFVSIAILCVVSFIVTAGSVALVQYYDRRNAQRLQDTIDAYIEHSGKYDQREAMRNDPRLSQYKDVLS